MERHLKLVPSFILAVFLFGQATKVEKDAEVTVKLRKIFGSLTSDEDIKKNTQQNLQSMFNLADRHLDHVLDGNDNDILKEIYQENTAADVEKQLLELFGGLKSQAQIPSAEDIRKNIKHHLRKMIEKTEGDLQTYKKLSDVLASISEDNLRKYYQKYKAEMLMYSEAVAVSLAVLEL